MYSKLDSLIKNLDFAIIPTRRKILLQELASFIQAKHDVNDRINLTCICTHNSRRSHLTQIWTKLAGVYYRIRKVNSYSGGTEATAVHPQIIDTLLTQGFEITKLSESANPVYALRFDKVSPPLVLFSKVYDHHFNPSQNFMALMTCSDADIKCPIVHGSDAKIALPFEDPKRADNNADIKKIYLDTSLEIAREILYAFSLVEK